MVKRGIRILRHIGAAPVVAVCTNCSREFKAKTVSLRSVKDATDDLQTQFDQHACKVAETNPGVNPSTS